MVTFIGDYTSKLDDKGRLVFPAPLKGVMPEGGDMRFVIKKDINKNIIYLSHGYDPESAYSSEFHTNTEGIGCLSLYRSKCIEHTEHQKQRDFCFSHFIYKRSVFTSAQSLQSHSICDAVRHR